MTAAKVTKAALAMPLPAQMELVEALLTNLAGPVDPAIEKAWAPELERRWKRYKSGKTRVISAQEMFASLSKRSKRCA